jgi:magnesium transporter
MRLARLIVPELKTLLAEHPEQVREVLDEIHPEDLADVIAELDLSQAGELLTHLPTEYAAQVFRTPRRLPAGSRRGANRRR